MNCIYKIGDKEYTLEELQKFLENTESVGEVENKQTSPTNSINNNAISQDPETIGVRSNPAYSQKPYESQDDQIEAFPILSNEEGSVQFGTQLVLTKVENKWKHKFPYLDYEYQLRNKEGVYIGSLKTAENFNFDPKGVLSKEVVEELRNRYKARLAILDNLISTTSGQVLIEVIGKSEGMLLNMNDEKNLSQEEKQHSVDFLIGEDTEAKLVNISSANGKDFTISLNGKEVPLMSSGYHVDIKQVEKTWGVINPSKDGFRSMLLLPTPVRTAKGVFYKLLPTDPTKIFSTTNPKTQFPEFTNTVKTVLNAIKNKNFENVTTIGIVDNKTAVNFLNKFFMDVQLIKRANDNTAVQFGTGANSTVGEKFDIDSQLRDINTVLTYTPEDETITLLNESGEEVKYSYKTISQKLHTTTYNYSTAIEGQPRTYFSNPQVALDLKNPKVNGNVTMGNEPVKTTQTGESQPVTEVSVKKPLKGKGSKKAEINDNGTSKALDIDQINNLIELAKGNNLQSTLELVKSLANELSSDLLEGLSFEASKKRIKEQLQDNLERAEVLSTQEGLEENFNDIDDYEKNIEYNKQVVIDVTKVLENFEKFFENAENLLEDSGFTQKEGTYLEPEFDKEVNDVIPDEDEEQSVDDQGTSDKIHTKTALEYNPFYEMDGKVKAFLNSISKEMASFLNMNASYGAEQLFSEIADLVVVNEVNTTEDFKALVQKQYDKTNAYHLKDFLWKFNRLTIENQNGIVKSFSLTKNRLVGTKGGKVFESNRNDRYLQLKDFLDNRFKELFLNEDESLNTTALEEFRDYIISLVDKKDADFKTNSVDFEEVLNKLGFGITSEQKQQLDKIFITEDYRYGFYSELKKAINQVLSGNRSIEKMSQNIVKELSERQFESIMFSNRGTVIVNKDGNKIYIYSVPNNNAEINKRAGYYKGLLQQNPFSSLSTLAEKLEDGTAKPIYMDGVEDEGFSKLNMVEKLHARATFFFKSVFNGKKNYPFFSSAKSDKVPVDGLEVPKVDYVVESAKDAF